MVSRFQVAFGVELGKDNDVCPTTLPLTELKMTDFLGLDQITQQLG
jgi:hypothetical protein